MIKRWVSALLVCVSVSVLSVPAQPKKKAPPRVGEAAIVDRVRYIPAPKGEKAMVGAKITGSNTSRTEGFEVLAEIQEEPKAGQWNELRFPNKKVYRWLRYEAPPGSYGKVAEIEMYAEDKKLSGKGTVF